MKAHFSCLPPASFLSPLGQLPAHSTKAGVGGWGAAGVVIRMGWPEKTAMQSHSTKTNHIRSLPFLPTTDFRKEIEFTGFVS